MCFVEFDLEATDGILFDRVVEQATEALIELIVLDPIRDSLEPHRSNEGVDSFVDENFGESAALRGYVLKRFGFRVPLLPVISLEKLVGLTKDVQKELVGERE